MNKVYLGLGSNVGDSLSAIKKVITTLNEDDRINVTNQSSFYETTPYGNVNQNNFINAVIEIETGLNCSQLLEFNKNLERNFGREKRERWGPREIDIDIILFNDDIFHTEKLNIPHPDLINRDFVLVPLLEINDKLVHPETKKILSEYLDTKPENHILNKLKNDHLT